MSAGQVWKVVVEQTGMELNLGIYSVQLHQYANLGAFTSAIRERCLFPCWDRNRTLNGLSAAYCAFLPRVALSMLKPTGASK